MRQVITTLILLCGMATTAEADFSYKEIKDDFDDSITRSIAGLSKDGIPTLLWWAKNDKPLTAENLVMSFGADAVICGNLNGRVTVKYMGIRKDSSKTEVKTASFSARSNAIYISGGNQTSDVLSIYQIMGTSSQIRLKVDNECGNSVYIELDLTGFNRSTKKFMMTK